MSDQECTQEYEYLSLIDRILKTGTYRKDRTNTGTLSIFGVQMRYDVSNGVMPLLTTKRVFWRGIVEELLWFISGNTSSKTLAAKGVHIWDAHGSAEFLKSRGLLHREPGDLGPVYGFQWRHFGAKYINCDTDYTGQGIDQLQEVIRQIREEPSSRRIIMSAWNPIDLNEMALPPCHVLVQFFVSCAQETKTKTKKLSCMLYQRSADVGLGVPFNIASYSLLLHMIAHVCELEVGEFIHTIGDAHIYVNHVEQLKAQMTREPRDFPKLVIKRRVINIDDFTADDFELVGYTPHPAISMDMSV